MILISSPKAEAAISENTFSSKSKFKYLFVTYLFLTISGPIYLITPTFEGDGNLYALIVSLTTWLLYIYISFVGIEKCYLKNILIDDFYFIERFTILNIPVLIMFFLIALPLRTLNQMSELPAQVNGNVGRHKR